MLVWYAGLGLSLRSNGQKTKPQHKGVAVGTSHGHEHYNDMYLSLVSSE